MKVLLNRFALATVIADQQQTNNIQVLPIVFAHVLALQDFPTHHKDPFDRLLIAQAKVEEAILISHDPVFAQYPVEMLWLVGYLAADLHRTWRYCRETRIEDRREDLPLLDHPIHTTRDPGSGGLQPHLTFAPV